MNANEKLALRHVLASVDEAETHAFVAKHMLNGIRENPSFIRTSELHQHDINELQRDVDKALELLAKSVTTLKLLTR